MANHFVFSDPHFGHAGILAFIVHRLDCPQRGKKLLRDVVPGPRLCDCPLMRSFKTVEEMDETIIAKWNAVVNPPDKVYVLGDVAMKWHYIATIGRCNGHKDLIRGNHDTFPTKKYLPFFKEIYGSRLYEDMLLTHIPIHPESLRYNWTNVHGHVHSNVGPLHFGHRYLNVSCEVTDYQPLAIEEVRQLIRAQKEENQRQVDANLRRLGITPWQDLGDEKSLAETWVERDATGG